jgi:DNA polymerase III subunit delta'
MIQELLGRVNIVLSDEHLTDNLEDEIKQNGFNLISFKYSEENKSLSPADVLSILNQTKLTNNKKFYILISRNIRNTEIQNSLLKTLEESSTNYIFVIFTRSQGHLLNTLKSRSIIINKLDKKNLFSDTKRKLILANSIGLLDKVIFIEDKYSRGLLSEKQVKEFINML